MPVVTTRAKRKIFGAEGPCLDFRGHIAVRPVSRCYIRQGDTRPKTKVTVPFAPVSFGRSAFSGSSVFGET